MGDYPEITIRPVGLVKNGINERMRHGWGEVESELIIDPELTELLDGLQNFSHIVVIYWMHKSAGTYPAKVHPRGISEAPLTGVFATRSPRRPNAIGVTTVELLECNENKLRVRGLDAVHGTPIIDIKPYLPGDFVQNVRYPEWISRLDPSQEAWRK
ncbi:MAG: tRNA (N6-threonylcarbamoyladenosine(37)-N6)-methyltransferase TrmO [Dehalococcoidia bacterium]